MRMLRTHAVSATTAASECNTIIIIRLVPDHYITVRLRLRGRAGGRSAAERPRKYAASIDSVRVFVRLPARLPSFTHPLNQQPFPEARRGGGRGTGEAARACRMTM